MVSDYIYIVHCEQHKHTNIYKIGRTSQQEFRRFNGYPKNSELLLYIHVNDSHAIELELLTIFKEKYKQITSAGVEYFQGDVHEMVKDIVKIALNNFDSTNTKPVKSDLINIFPNYKYDYSFGGRHRLCILKNNKLYYIEQKDLMSCEIDKVFSQRIFQFYKNDKNNNIIKNNVYFKYTEKIIEQIILLLPYNFSEIITDNNIDYFNYNSFLNNPQYLFSCNCKINNNYYININKNNNKYIINNQYFIHKNSFLISVNLIDKIIPFKTLFIDTHYGVIFDNEFTDDVDCVTVVNQSKSIENDVLLYYIFYNHVLCNKECLVENYTNIVDKYLNTIAKLINDIINIETIKELYDPFKDATSPDDVLQSYKNYIDVMTACNKNNLFDDTFNYGLYWLLMKEQSDTLSLNDDINDWLFNEYTTWVQESKLNYHSACKWWFKNTQQWKINQFDTNKVKIDWNNISFQI